MTWAACDPGLPPRYVLSTKAPATKKVVLLGMMTRIPVAGVVWRTVHYLLGLQRLGYEVYYVETHARTPAMLMEREEDDGSARPPPSSTA